MIRIVCFIVLAMSFMSVHAQNFEWVSAMGGVSEERGTSVTADLAGNVYVTGFFFGTVDFDPASATSNLSSNGNFDVFVQKLDSLGQLIWVKSFGGIDDDQGTSVCVDDAQNTYVCGYFTSTMDLDPGAGTQMVTSNGMSDIFMVKLDSNGNFLWGKTFGAAASDRPNKILMDRFGALYLAGSFQNTVDFDPGPGTVNLTATGGENTFLLKFDTAGTLIRANSITATHCNALATDSLGNMYLGGDYNVTSDLNPDSGVATYFSTADAMDGYVLKLDSGGNYIWAKTIGGDGDDVVQGLCVGSQGEVYLSGQFYKSCDFDPGPNVETGFSAGSSDAYVLKLDQNGLFKWSKTLGAGFTEQAHSVQVDGSGQVYIGGNFGQTVDFNPGTDVEEHTSKGNYDVFIEKLDSAGNFLWVKPMGGSEFDFSANLFLMDSNHVYSTGHCTKANFNNGIGNSTTTQYGSKDIYVLKMSSCALSRIDTLVTLNGATLTALANNLYYQWVDCGANNYPISNAVEQDFSPKWIGHFAVELNNGGCTVTTPCLEVLSVGMEENSFPADFTFYPIPTSGVLTIEKQIPDPIDFVVSNALGQKLASIRLNAASQPFDFSSFPRGIYYLTGNAGGTAITQKIILQ